MSTATPARTPDQSVKAMLTAAADRLQAVLPKHLTPERMAQVVSTMVYRTPKLAECSPHSIVAAVFQAAELGLDLSTAMGEAYLVPRWNSKARCNECTFLPGYKGLVKLARQSGEIASIQARLVRKADVFRYCFTPDLDFYHEPDVLPAEGDAVTHAYAVAKLANGEHLIEVMSRDEIEAIRARSQSRDAGPWVTDWCEMAKKTVLRRLCKVLPRSIELAQAIEADEAEYRTDDRAEVRPAGSRAAALADRLGAPPALPAPEDDDLTPQAELDADAEQ
jgi:recombination protein RecT